MLDIHFLRHERAGTMEYPDDILLRAEETLDRILCNDSESCGGFDGMRRESILDIAAALMAERESCGGKSSGFMRDKCKIVATGSVSGYGRDSYKAHCVTHDAKPGRDGMCAVGRAEAVVEDMRAEVQALRELVENINLCGETRSGLQINSGVKL
jgi:hypothetical protein